MEVKSMAEAKFEMFRDRKGEYRFRLKAPNGERVAASEGYKGKTSCRNGIESFAKSALKAEIVDLTDEEAESQGGTRLGRTNAGLQRMNTVDKIILFATLALLTVGSALVILSM